MPKHFSSLFGFGAAALAALSGACVQDGEPQTLVSVSVPLVNDQCNVTSARVTVTASDIDHGIYDTLDVSGDAIVGSIADVPAGPERLVTVEAYSDYRVVYRGSALVDVVDGQTASASLVLYRNWDVCPATSGSGDVEVLGDLDNGDAAGPAAIGQFSFSDAVHASNGVLYFLDTAGNRVRRLDTATRAFLAPLAGTLSPVTSFAVTPDGATVYLAYEGGRIDAFDAATGTPRLFAVAPQTVSAMVVAGDYVFAGEGSYYYSSTQALYARSTGQRVASATSRRTGRQLQYSAVNRRVYFLESDYNGRIVSVPVAASPGELLGAESYSPYQPGGNSLPAPLRLSADEDTLVLGNGSQYSATDLTYVNSFGLPVVDAAFVGGTTYVMSRQGDQNSSSGQTLIRALDENRTILGNRILPGTPLRIYAAGTQLVVVTQQGRGQLAVRVIDAF